MKHSGTRHGEYANDTERHRTSDGRSSPHTRTRRRRAYSTTTTRHHTQRGGARPAPSRRTAPARPGAPSPPAACSCASKPPLSRPAPRRRSEPIRRRRRRQRRPHQPPRRREVARAARRARRARSRASTLRSLCKQPLRGCARAQPSERCVERRMPLWPSSTPFTSPAAAATQHTQLLDVEDESCAHGHPQLRPHPPQVHQCEWSRRERKAENGRLRACDAGRRARRRGASAAIVWFSPVTNWM